MDFGLRDYAALAAIIVALVSLRELTRPARLRRNLKSDADVLATLPEGDSKDRMQRLVDEQVTRLDRLAHPDWGRRINLAFALVQIGLLGVALMALVIAPRANIQFIVSEGPVLWLMLLAGVPMTVEGAVRGYRVLRGRPEFTDVGDIGEPVRRRIYVPKKDADDVEERRPEQDEHTGP